MLTFRSVADLNRAIVSGLHRIDRAQYDVVVGIPRSGMIPASILSTHLQLPLSDVESFARGYQFGRSGRVGQAGKSVLLVDDTSNRGGAMARAVERIGAAATTITRCAVYGPYKENVVASDIIDLYFEDCVGPRAFQWNWLKHTRAPRWAYDMDGVLCRDPSKAENDDGENYLRFLREAEPLFLPVKPIGHIVTCRLEKYRAHTEEWLKRHGVSFQSLTMMPFATKAERMAMGGRGPWKAEQAMRLGVELFIESNPKQAVAIAAEANIPVWCTSTQEVACPPSR